MKVSELKKAVLSGGKDAEIRRLYGEPAIPAQRRRYAAALDAYAALWGDSEGAKILTVPGRSEICGNHTDHNRGRVVAAAVNLDIIAVAARSHEPERGIIRVKSEGFDGDEVSLANTSPSGHPRFSSAALIAGVCEGFNERGYKTGAFNAYTTSDVLIGSGLSSSAAFEVMIASILNNLYNNSEISSIELAKIAQYAENVHFGKPCGLMDQTACAVGGFVAIDFEDALLPIVTPIDFDLGGAGYSLCIVNTGSSHADLGEEYASVPAEMKAVAAALGRDVLRGVSCGELLREMPRLRESVGDRALLRAMHFIDEDALAADVAERLKRGDVAGFIEQINASGNSSYKRLQNIYTASNPADQGIAVALALAEKTLEKVCGCSVGKPYVSVGKPYDSVGKPYDSVGKPNASVGKPYDSVGKPYACRVHGGGFAGTIQIIAPDCALGELRHTMDGVFGQGACAVLTVRADGATEL